eukprot:TRINITY_DN1660_c0_g1_i1.p1 TRINITY_DN1660_c0_g1~~TRINITY_DN1660_c0_g1_i1.p1  ORF type:complete len:224 (+),score=60.03 TRINITY_DN1660_c0_g1_i1:251-922(+)
MNSNKFQKKSLSQTIGYEDQINSLMINSFLINFNNMIDNIKQNPSVKNYLKSLINLCQQYIETLQQNNTKQTKFSLERSCQYIPPPENMGFRILSNEEYNNNNNNNNNNDEDIIENELILKSKTLLFSEEMQIKDKLKDNFKKINENNDENSNENDENYIINDDDDDDQSSSEEELDYELIHLKHMFTISLNQYQEMINNDPINIHLLLKMIDLCSSRIEEIQ